MIGNDISIALCDSLGYALYKDRLKGKTCVQK